MVRYGAPPHKKGSEGKLTGRGSATEILGVHYTTLKYKMRKYGLEPGQPP